MLGHWASAPLRDTGPSAPARSCPGRRETSGGPCATPAVLPPRGTAPAGLRPPRWPVRAGLPEPPAAPEPVDVGSACELRRRRSRQLHRVPIPASTRPSRRPRRRRGAAWLTARGSFSTACTGELSWALTHSAFLGGDPPGAREGVRAAPPSPAQAGDSGSEDGGMRSQGPPALSRQACAEPSLGTRRR